MNKLFKKRFFALVTVLWFINHPLCEADPLDNSYHDVAADEKRKCHEVGETIGGAGDVGTARVCCSSLQLRDHKNNYSEGCENISMSANKKICIACGNGTCEQDLENNCNCPEDCGAKSH